MRNSTPVTVYLKDYKVSDWLIDHVDLHIALDGDAATVKSTLRVRRNPESIIAGERGNPPLVLNGEGLETRSISMNGRKLLDGEYKIAADSLTIPVCPDSFEIHTEVGIEPGKNTALNGLYRSNGNYITQCEPQGFRHITWHPDRSDLLSTFTTTIEAEPSVGSTQISNGNLVSDKILPNGRRETVYHDPYPKPSYLFALVAGKLEAIEHEFTTMNGRKVKLMVHAESQNKNQIQFAMESLIKAFEWDEKRFGREYLHDVMHIVATSDFNFGAMENTTLNIFNTSAVLAHPETATDADFARVESVVGHEFFHYWSGNFVTLRDMFQLTLKEGFTVFRDQEFSSDLNVRAIQRIEDVDGLRRMQFKEDAGPTAHPPRPASYIQIDNFYTATVYEKGAEIVRMLHTLLGEETFRNGTDLYFSSHQGKAATCEDFLAAMSAVSGRDFSQFKNWYEQAGTPTVHAHGVYDAESRTYRLTLKQTPATINGVKGKNLHIPVSVGLLKRSNGKPIALRMKGEFATSGETRVLELTESEQVFVFEDIREDVVPSLLRNFSAPVHLVFPQGEADLPLLLSHDTDAFVRWEAAQKLGENMLLSLVADIQAGRPLAPDPSYLAALQKVVTDTSIDSAFKALLLTLPGQDVIAQKMAIIDPDAIAKAHDSLRYALSVAFKDAWASQYQASSAVRDYAYSPDEVGRRALRNLSLSYRMAPDASGFIQDEAIILAAAQYHSSDNMTERFAALSVLCRSDSPERTVALNDFYDRFKSNALVIDKWFRLQASTATPSVVEKTAELLNHPDFRLTNPNRARALIGAFGANPLGFHRADGAGYKLVADVVIQADDKNPKLATGLLRPFLQWQRYDAARQTQMKEQLLRIAAKPKLSSDLYEIVHKCLGTDSHVIPQNPDSAPNP